MVSLQEIMLNLIPHSQSTPQIWDSKSMKRSTTDITMTYSSQRTCQYGALLLYLMKDLDYHL